MDFKPQESEAHFWLLSPLLFRAGS